MRWILPASLVVPFIVSFIACSVDSPAPDHTSFPSCEAIAVACHNRDIDEDGGTAEDCHVLGHLSRTEQACAEKKEVCLRYCSGDGGPEAGIFGDGGDEGDGGDGGDDQ